MGCLGDINNELLVHIGGHLSLNDLKQFSLVCHKFALVAHSDVLWKEKLYNDYGITYKLPDESWKEMYNRKTEDPNHCRMCPHVACVDNRILEPYVVKYRQLLNWLEKNLNCSVCKQNCKDTGLCLYVWKGNVRARMYSIMILNKGFFY
ncbi:hypothetical protein BDB01DRAFT_778038 [Pilobolus umbonatus]|nr:hypothetical protein BDB01DRAFT_778038 [Pilobolus umbonatus]